MELQSADGPAWVALKMVRGVGNVLGLNLVRSFGSPREAFRASTHALECAGVRRDVARAIRRFGAWDEAEAQLAQLAAAGGRLVTWTDEGYPENLRHIRDAPLFLFVKGHFAKADALAVAVVGSRAASAYGRQVAAQISEGLARYGVTVVSGLARGIDAVAHASALRAGGRTIAVLGCGIDVTYPSEHHRLQMSIAEHGAVVSEFRMGTQPEAENFPARNRIISGMCLGTLVVEAHEKSGSLITAQFANEQGRDVFAVPGPVGVRSRGTHQLLRDGAGLVERAEDVVAEVAPQLVGVRAAGSVVARAQLDGTDALVFSCVREDATHVDRIIEQSGLAPAAVLETLLRLELNGVVRQLPGKCFSRDAGVSSRSGRAVH